jgi:hypothetical protein
MKFELNLAVKAVPMADCHISLECSPDELGMLLSDPVYQKLGQKLAEEVSFKRSSSDSGNRPQANHQRHGHQQAQDRQHDHRKADQRQEEALKTLDQLRKTVEKSSKARHGSFAEAFGDGVREARRNWGELD